MPVKTANKTELSAGDRMKQCCRKPWEVYTEPFKMARNVWYISGNDWVACYLIETSEGLILIDTAMHETVHMMIENIHKIGFELTDIKKILLTHAHIDHIGAARIMKELTGAEVYMGERDLALVHKNHELVAPEISGYIWSEFETDVLFSDDKAVTLGEISIQTISSPGHTPGCTSLFFDVKHFDGSTLKCGLHGGLGLNTLNKKFFEKYDEPASLRDEFIDGLKSMMDMEIDLCLPSHTNQVEILPLIPQISDSYNPFIDKTAWKTLLSTRLNSVYKLIESEK